MYIYILVVLLITFLATLSIRKKYNILAYQGPYRPVNTTHKWVERVLLLIGVLFVVCAFIYSNPEIYFLLLIGIFILMSGFRTFMEFKHDPEKKEYLVQFIWTIGYSALLIGFFAFLF